MFPKQTYLSYLILFLNWVCVVSLHAESLPLTDLSLEDLMNIEVSLVSRKQEKWFETPAAVYVLTHDDLHRLGATSIPEALRLVPGIQVARVDANKWAVSARGLNGRFAQNLLVLIDGRTVYTPLFSGVFWEMRDVLFEDVDRIEIIRGPGGTLWGANAVNGIINIVTKPANETQGGFVKVGTGTEERGFAHIRYGGQLSPNTSARAYGKFFLRDAFVDATGNKQTDDWHMSRGGFHINNTHTHGTLTLQGDIFSGSRGQIYRFPQLTPPYQQTINNKTKLSGGNLLARWTLPISPTSEIRLQTYYDRSNWHDTLFVEKRGTYDLDLQHRFNLGSRLNTVWGAGYRVTRDTLQMSPWESFTPPSKTDRIYSAFWQNTLTLVPRQLTLSFGTKLEHNSHTGFEYQPGTRLLWTPNKKHTFWISATRAVRTPSRSDEDIKGLIDALPPDSLVKGSPPVLAYYVGNPNIKSGTLHAFEWGYRLRPKDNLVFDVATYYNDYANLRGGEILPITFSNDPPPFHVNLNIQAKNNVWGEIKGIEWATDWQMSHKWRMRANYTYLDIDMHTTATTDLGFTRDETRNPKHQATFWLSITPNPQWHLDTIVRYVDQLPDIQIKRYTELDLNLQWSPHPQLDIAVIGQNLLHAHHPEFEVIFVNTKPTETQRGIYTTLTWTFKQ